jgi:hypothetical protein
MLEEDSAEVTRDVPLTISKRVRAYHSLDNTVNKVDESEGEDDVIIHLYEDGGSVEAELDRIGTVKSILEEQTKQRSNDNDASQVLEDGGYDYVRTLSELDWNDWFEERLILSQGS